MYRRCCAFLAILLLAGGCVSQPVGAPEAAFTAQVKHSKETVFPALVFIKPIQEEFSGGKRVKQQIFGSGVIIDPKRGYVVTNNHVAEKSTEITCVLSNREEISAEVVGLDPETDLAVLRLNMAEVKEPLAHASFGDSSTVEVGDTVIAMGSPYGFDRSASMGIASNTERFFEHSRYNLWIQTDAAINPGNSGGPLVNLAGEIIGINALGLTGADNMGFAIPSNVARSVVDVLIRNEKIERAWTGIMLQALKDFNQSTTIASDRGVLIASIEKGSPAEKAGLRTGDVILSVNGEDLNGIYPLQLPAIETRLAALPVGKEASFLVLRDGQQVLVSAAPRLKGKQEGDDFEAKRWNMTVKEITDFTFSHLRMFRKEGVYIQGLDYGGNGQGSGLQEMDILTRIGDAEITSLDEFKKAYEESLKVKKGNRKILVEVLRDGFARFVALDYEKDIEKIREEE